MFLGGFEGNHSVRKETQARCDHYVKLLQCQTADFQTELGYPLDLPGEADLAVSNNLVAERYGAVALTLEMPFKDHDPSVDPIHGWSPERSARLGRDCLVSLLQWLSCAT